MNCHEVRRHWNLYHDSEGDQAVHFAINEHLAMCPACAQWFSEQSRLEHLVAEKIAARKATPDLWRRVLEKVGLVRPSRVRSWLFFSGLAACFVLVLGLGAWYFVWRAASGPSEDLNVLTAQWHEKLASGGAVVQFRSDSDLEVEGFLRRKVEFPVRCPPRKDTGFAVHGAGVVELAELPVAYLTGQVDDEPVSILIMRKDNLEKFPAQFSALQGKKAHYSKEGSFGVAFAVIDRNTVVVVGRLTSERLLRVLYAYGTYPDHPG